MYHYMQYPFGQFYMFGPVMGLVSLLAIWEIAWKGYGLWKAAQNNEKWWFIAILVLNTAGILPIFYIYVFNKTAKKK